MALVSPGLQLTVTDESQYVSAAVGTVPFVVLATAQDKTINGAVASGTTKTNAGKLQIFGSQRELATAMGYPVFKQSSAGTPLHGDELNEYGLMASYSSLGLGNRLYAIRADIDLNQLTGTAVRPTGTVADGTYWLDLANTSWGIFSWSSATQSFSSQTPTVITESADTTSADFDTLLSIPKPIDSIGSLGAFAVVTTDTNNRVFFKAGSLDSSTLPDTTANPLYNTWVLVGSTDWQRSIPAVVGTVSNPTITLPATITINTTPVSITGTTAADVAGDINDANITGVRANVYNNRVAIYGDSTSASGGSTADGKIAISSSIATAIGITSGTYNTATVQYSPYSSVPQWTTADTGARFTGSVWFKTSVIGAGANFVFRKYNDSTATWISQATQSYTSEAVAIYGIDPSGGGTSIAVGAVYLLQDPNPESASVKLGTGGFNPLVRTVGGAVKVTGTVPQTNFGTGSSVIISATQPGTSSLTTQTVSIGGSPATASDVVSAILGANIPNVVANLEANGAISITHSAGGTIVLTDNGLTSIATVAGFVSGTTGVRVSGTDHILSGFTSLTYTPSITELVAAPAVGTLWYNSDATVVDVMVNDGQNWKGYQNVSSDVRGYNLANTDPQGVIVTASKPTTQTDNSALVAGDLWLDTSDLENWPKLSRYTGSSWVSIDNTDQISQNGIVFADARWDTNGLVNPVFDNEVSTVSLLTSNYVDLDAPNAELYPRGALLFNTRRSGYNVKRYVSNYYDVDAFSVDTYSSSVVYSKGNKAYYGTTIYVAVYASSFSNQLPTNTTYWEPLVVDAWVTASGNKVDGSPYAGHKAQRQMVVEAMKSAIDSNTQIREDQFQFNLVAAPGYPELISNMVSLNNDRANTAFIIGDTPMSLSTNVVEITNWSTDATGDGLATSDPYLGVYYPSGISNDVGGNTIMVPPSHIALRTFIRNDNVSFPWFAPAGTRRGLVDNATDIGYLDTTTGEFVRTGVNKSLRDSLYSLNINPITILNGIGLVVWGQKTRNPVASSLDRVNVARLVNYIRTILASSGNGFLFEPNDKITRDQLKQIIESALNDLVAKRGIYDYVVVCDTSNNTPDRIARNELYVDIAIEPMKDVEFIYIPIRLMNPGDVAKLGK